MDRTELLKQSHKKMKAKKKSAVTSSHKPGGPKTNRTEHMALRLTKETRQAVELAAHETHRTASNWIETAVCWALKEGAVLTRQVVPRPKRK